MRYIFLPFYICIIFSCNQPPQGKELNHQVANAHGFNSFDTVQMLEFTFNVQRDSAPATSRHWRWFPKTNEIVRITDSSNTKFIRGDTTTKELKKLNAQFTNDEYWLLFPLHLRLDEGFEFRDSSIKVAPVSGQKQRKLTIAYNDVKGFTPGDMYDVYIDENLRIKEWAFHKAGVAEPGLITTWENYKDFNGLQLAQDHISKDRKFRLWFTGIQVKSK